MKHDSPIFIVGMPRSGTTLMRAALSSHPNIAIAPETHFLSYWMRRHGTPEPRDREDFERFWRAFIEHRQFTSLELDADALAKRLLAGGTPSFRTVFSTLLEAYASRLDKPRWGEKTPAHHQHLGRLLEWYPQGRVIHMLRDPRAVVASLLDAPWAAPRLELHAARWRDSARALVRWERDPRVGVVHYEALVTDPEPVLRAVCAFLDEPFDPALLDRSRAAQPTADAYDGWGLRHLRAAVEPIRTDSVAKWQHRLSMQEVATVEYLTRKGMRRYGYEPVTAGPGAVAWSALMTWRLWSRLRQEVRRVRGQAVAPVSDQPPGTAASAAPVADEGDDRASAEERRRVL